MEPWHGPARALVPLLGTITVWALGRGSLPSGCLQMTSHHFYAEEEALKYSVISREEGLHAVPRTHSLLNMTVGARGR